ncbi:MAG: rhodanese-like domain-containing protein [Gammaproteobacteria bacterium]|mgnify:FL=1|nr:rhodanese-like domain-containing protein [Gammaproteobacteria bacterium]MBT4462354.1 rhodanese-like domain-containing protein [Gammaproteobacteria bacterium]MBT5117207.1 rhodanese-like domain-containing protein [Gammaproteobacteria bacterium]MBT5762096.1 rhodanese-like domain-containing protein [Gammaproteobacteria bacterium]MBT6331671.1 rhodanese-like domain-containing protein [Gammaproteobacteria bacterium]
MEFISNNIILFIALIILVILIINLETKSLFGKVQKLSCDELTKLLNNSKINLLDFRTKEEFSAGHIITAKNLSLDDIEKVSLKSDNPYVAYADTDTDALKAATMFSKLGIQKIFYLEGGIKSWIENNMPLTGED